MENENKLNQKEEAKEEEASLEKVEENNDNKEDKAEELPPEPTNFTYEDENLQKVENNRIEFLKFYRKQGVLKWVIGLVALAIVIFAWVGLPNIFKDADGNQPGWILPVMIVVVVVSLLLVFTYTFLTRRVVNKKMKTYFADFYESTKNYVFNQEGFSDALIQNPDKIAKVQFDENLMYANVSEIGSRGLTEFKYHDKAMMVCDCAAQVRGDKRIMPVFVGKYLIGPASYKDEPIIIYLKGDKRALPPTNTEGMKIVHDDKDLVIYSNNKDWSKVINSKVMKSLKGIKLNKFLIDVAISLNNDKTYMCLGYDDPLMVLPLENPFNPNPFTSYKEDLVKFTKIIEELSK